MLFKRHYKLLTLILLLLSYYYCLVTNFTLNPFEHEIWRQAYDSLGNSLLIGRADLAPDAIGWEGFDIDGKKVMYFGPFPAFLRIIFNFLFENLYGFWPRVSNYLACSSAFFAGALLLSFGVPSLRLKYFLFLGFGSPLVYLVSCSRIHNEAVSWGLALSLAALYAYKKYEHSKRQSWLLIFSSFAALCLLARITFALPLYIFILFLSCIIFRSILFDNTNREKNICLLACLLLPAICGFGFQLWYNFARFGSVFETFPYQLNYFRVDKWGGFYNIKRVLDTFFIYITGSFDSFTVQAPYVRLAYPKFIQPELFFMWNEAASGVLFQLSWLIIPACCGILQLTKNYKNNYKSILFSIFLFIQIILIMSYGFVANRYITEFLPLLCWTASFYKPGNRAFGRLIIASGIFAIIFNNGSTFYYNMAFNPDNSAAYRKALWRFFAEDPYRRLANEESQVPVFSNPRPAVCRGRDFAKSVGLKGRDELKIEVPQDKKTFTALLCTEDAALSCLKLDYHNEILNDKGDMIFKSVDFNPYAFPQNISVDVGESKFITLVNVPHKKQTYCDAGNWIEAGFE